jgi:hypothetical protein
VRDVRDREKGRISAEERRGRLEETKRSSPRVVPPGFNWTRFVVSAHISSRPELKTGLILPSIGPFFFFWTWGYIGSQ